MKERIDILDIFYKLSSDDVRYLLLDLSVFPEETGGLVLDVLATSEIKNLEILQSSFEELQQFGLVGTTKHSDADKLQMSDRIWLKKGVTELIKKHITEEED